MCGVPVLGEGEWPPGAGGQEPGGGRGTHITSSRAVLESFPPSETMSQV